MAWPLSFSRTEEYQYANLESSPRTFRVIRLLPSTRSLLPPFRETLNVEILELNTYDHAGTYDTLSYCWGVGTFSRDVIVWLPSADTDTDNASPNTRQRRRLRISASLEEALLSIARQSEAGISRPLFADQICINQASSAEKISQVRLMGEIYSHSARTIVWLGPQSGETRRYYDFAGSLNSEAVLGRVMGPNKGHAAQVLDAVVDPATPLTTQAEVQDRDDMLRLVTRYGARIPLRGMAEILRRSWMERLWTVQEGCLPPEVTFRCGELSLCFDCFRAVLFFYAVATRYWARYNTASVSREEMQMREKMFDLNKPIRRLVVERKRIHDTQGSVNKNTTAPMRTTTTPLFELVLRHNVNDATPKLGATKAEDRIYALLGLAAVDDEVTKETIEGMEVDNTRGAYTKFAASVVRRNVDVLLFVQGPRSSAEGYKLPSWVPDWSLDPLQTPYGYTDLSTPLFSAGGQLSDKIINNNNNIEVDVTAGILRLDAIAVGRVVKVGAKKIKSDPESFVGNVDYACTWEYLEELKAFIKAAALTNPSGDTTTNVNTLSPPQPLLAEENANRSEEEQQEALLLLETTVSRISDGGLSTKEFPKFYTAEPSSSSPSSGAETEENIPLLDVFRNVSIYAKNMARIDTQTKALGSFLGMLRHAASNISLPWYWTPQSEMDVLRLCAVSPVSALRSFGVGAWYALTDVVQVFWSSTYVRAHATYVRVRRARKWITLNPTPNAAAQEASNVKKNEEILRRVGGIERKYVQTKEWNHYTGNLLRNAGRRLFVTDTGRVGLGPGHMRVGDVVVVIVGGSTAHALRPTLGGDDEKMKGMCGNKDMKETSSWEYVGEVYCDGVMDGELVSGEKNSKSEITRYEIV